MQYQNRRKSRPRETRRRFSRNIGKCRNNRVKSWRNNATASSLLKKTLGYVEAGRGETISLAPEYLTFSQPSIGAPRGVGQIVIFRRIRPHGRHGRVSRSFDIGMDLIADTKGASRRRRKVAHNTLETQCATMSCASSRFLKGLWRSLRMTEK